jgi:hypothetical protein
MAPKKKPQHQNPKLKSKFKPNAASSDSKPAAKLQISAANERGLRRLLLNTGRPAPSQPLPDASAQPSSANSTSGVGGGVGGCGGDGGVIVGSGWRNHKVKRLRNV